MPVDLEQFRRSHDHRRHCAGAPQPQEMIAARRRWNEQLKTVLNPGPARTQSDLAWIVMLYRQGIISKDIAQKVLRVLKERGGTGEDLKLREWLGGDEHAASAVNIGRTLQEPMSRLQLRAKLLDIFDIMLKTLGTLLDVAEQHVDTVMAGQTHLSHAQPTTYAAYLLAVHDCLSRGLDQLELAYRHTNQNSAGCGACSGTGWPVDRNMVSELLGFDELVEVAYDCEPGQDHALTILFALTNIGVLLSRAAMDFNIWGMEEVGMIEVDAGWKGQSSMMPQKAIPGSQFERIRLAMSNVVGEMIRGVVSNKGEPYEDMLPIYEAWRGALTAMCHLEWALSYFEGLLRNTTPNKDVMLRYAREGFSATPDIAVKLVRDKGYAGRQAHRICATMVRIARERGIKAYEVTGELLDEAARIVDEPEPHLSTEELRELLDPVKFIERHNNVGDPHPDESRRLIAKRRAALAQARQRHADRVARLEAAAKKLDAEVAAILAD